MYGNEAEVGEAIAASGLDRGDVFITSKLKNDGHEPDAARELFHETLKALGVDYVDLFLIHWPLPMRYDGDFVSTWKTLEEFDREGSARLCCRSLELPAPAPAAAARRDLHHSCGQPDRGAPVPDPGRRARVLRRAPDRGRGVVAARAGRASSTTRSSGRIAERTGKTPAQVVLRWHIQRGDIVFPKSVTPDRIRENIDIFDFELSGADVDDITLLNKNERTGPDPDKFTGR